MNKVKNHTIVFKTEVGSHLYGTNVETSDHDYVGVVMPNSNEVFGFELLEKIDDNYVDKHESGKNTKNAIDCMYHEYRKFVRLAKENNPNVVELLYSNKIEIIEQPMAAIIENRDIFLGKDSIKLKFLSYAKSQKHKMILKPDNYQIIIAARDFLLCYLGVETTANMVDAVAISKARKYVLEIKDIIDEKKAPIKFMDTFVQIGDLNLSKKLTIKKTISELEKRIKTATHRKDLWEKYGFDTKFAGHTIRLLAQANEMLRTGNLIYPLQDAELIRSIRTGSYTLDQILKMTDDYEKKVEDAYVVSKLQGVARHNDIQNIVVVQMQQWFNNGDTYE